MTIMRRRRLRLRLRYSSDEDGTRTSGIGDFAQTVGVAPFIQPETSQASASNPNSGETTAISGVEFIDVSVDPTPTPPDSSVATAYPVDPSESEGGNDYESLIGEVLSLKGIKLKKEWWVSCIVGLERSVPQFSSLDVAAKAKHCFEQFLFSDMNLFLNLSLDFWKLELCFLVGFFLRQCLISQIEPSYQTSYILRLKTQWT